MRRMPQQQYPNPGVRRERDPRAAKRQMLLLVGCLVLAGGFIFGVRQQIMAVECGYKTESLRREREQLLDEQRRLLLTLEENSSPVQLEQAARALGMQPAHAAQMDVAARRGAQAATQGARTFVGTATTATAVVRR